MTSNSSTAPSDEASSATIRQFRVPNSDEGVEAVVESDSQPLAIFPLEVQVVPKQPHPKVLIQ